MKGDYVVVEGAGCDDQTIVFESVFFYDGYDFKEDTYTPDEIESLKVDILFRDQEGNLTTEF